MRQKHLIWTDSYSEIESIAKDLAEERNAEAVGDEPVELDYEEAERINSYYLDDERINLNIKTDGEIIVIADLGLWFGRRQGYKTIGNNVSNCLYMSRDCLEAKWYCDAYNLLGVEGHHDGTNYYTYRERKPNISESAWETFLDKLYNGTATNKDISRYTKSLLPYIKEVYGW